MSASATVLLYLLKANAVLLLLAAAYFGLLRRLTFFVLNRAYLLLALLFAALYPALPVPALLPAQPASPVALVLTQAPSHPLVVPAAVAALPLDWATVALVVYATGAAVLLGRLLVQLLSLALLRVRSRPALVLGQPVRVLPGEISPFSFGRAIYLNPEQHPGPELAAVLRHEQVHVRQWHTFDVLLAQLAQAAAWCNPAAWLLRRAVLDNLEFLADQAVLAAGLDRRAYQYSLVRLSQTPPGPSLVSHFTFPTLKNRVIMMNTPHSSAGQLARYFVAGPLALVLALGVAGARAQGVGASAAVVTSAAPITGKPPHIMFFIDGQPADKATFYQIKGSNVANLVTAEQEAAHRLYGPDVMAVLSVTTKGHEGDPAALTIDRKLQEADAAPAAAATTGQRASAPAPVRYYLDGRPYLGETGQLNLLNIASVQTFTGEKALGMAGTQPGARLVVVTTQANQDRADVRAFNGRLGIASVTTAAPATPVASTREAGMPYLAAPALEYITQHFPAARLLDVTEVKAADGSARYRAEIATGHRPTWLLFDGQGKFLEQLSEKR
ncbi:MAG: hypothetical protein M3Y54_17190 [Bacteroidota bacterium]|nr:hypothetical protein [Bacteroidota bacterium]